MSLVRALDDLASKHGLKELGFTLLPGMDKMVFKCTEGCCEEKVKKVLLSLLLVGQETTGVPGVRL